MRRRLKTIGEACYMVPLGCLLLGIILFDLMLKNIEDRWNDPTRFPGRWKYGLTRPARFPLLPMPW